MAVFTKLSENDFISILENYNIGSYQSHAGIAEGVENTNFKLITSSGSYILTIYEKRVRPEDLPFFTKLQQKLNGEGFPCPMPIINNSGSLVSSFANKNFTIVTFLKGKWPTSISNNEVKQAGGILAELHKISQKFSAAEISRKNSMGKTFWLETYAKAKIEAEKKFKGLQQTCEKAFDLIKNWPESLPTGIIHADFFPDNVLFDNGTVSGVIDFYMSCNDILAYDLAIALNAWCFEKDYAFNITKANIMLDAYNKVRKLTVEELKYLPILCVGASLRFLSTRLYDYFNRDENAVVSVKSPNEYIEKLKFHLQVKSYKEYGL